MDNLAQSGPIDPRLASIARVVPHQVSQVRLSKTQLKVLQSINEGEEVTAQMISGRCGLSCSWASTILRRLFERCYLKRKRLRRVSGGVEFQYSRWLIGSGVRSKI